MQVKKTSVVHAKIKKKNNHFFILGERLPNLLRRGEMAHCFGGQVRDTKPLSKPEKRKLGLQIKRACKIEDDKRRRGLHLLRHRIELEVWIPLKLYMCSYPLCLPLSSPYPSFISCSLHVTKPIIFSLYLHTLINLLLLTKF